MSIAYDKYLQEHISNVKYAYEWIELNISAIKIKDILPNFESFSIFLQLNIHDESKFEDDEYDPYDNYFYIDADSPSRETKEEFDYAWLKHIHRNPHHWQHWVLIEDDGGTKAVKALDMPDNYIMEMICDWWSFSWKLYFDKIKQTPSENLSYETIKPLYEIFDWYDRHRDIIIFSERTKNKVEQMLDLIKRALDTDSVIARYTEQAKADGVFSI